MTHRHRVFNYLLQNQVILALALIVISWFIYVTHNIWIVFFLSYIICSSLLPFVETLRRHRFPTIFAILIPYIIALIVISLLVGTIVNTFIPDLKTLVTSLPVIIARSTRSLGITLDAKTLQSYFSPNFSTVSSNALEVTSSVFGGVFSLVTILIVSFYLLLYHNAFHAWVVSLFDKEHHKKVTDVLAQIDEKLGAWARGQLLLSVSIGISIMLALSLIGIPFAIPLGILAGLFELIPTLGPTLAAIPSVLIALTISPATAITVVALYIGIQFLESHVLVPNIMQKAVGLNPVLVIISIGIGANLLGIPGALLAVPFISFLVVIITGIRDLE